MPIPFLNILNGGAHAENSSDFQEYKIAAVGAPNFREAFRWSAEVFHALKTLLHERHLPTTVGDEGGFAPSLASNQEYVEVILGNACADKADKQRNRRTGTKRGDYAQQSGQEVSKPNRRRFVRMSRTFSIGKK
jgi:enolase